MSKKTNKLAVIAARIRRVERKCNRLIAEVAALRKALTPQPSELNDIIGHLHQTARALREQSQRERRYYERNAREL